MKDSDLMINGDSCVDGDNSVEVVRTEPEINGENTDHTDNEEIKQNSLLDASRLETPVTQTSEELEVPSKKVSITLNGEQYLRYKNMMDTLLFPKKTNASTKDEIILGSAIEYMINLSRAESRKSVDCKGTPFIAVSELLAKMG